MIDVVTNQEIVNDLKEFLDDIEKKCKEIRIWTHYSENNDKRFWVGQRKGLIEILLVFRPNSIEIMEHEKQKVKTR